MILFFDAVSTYGYIGLYSPKREQVASKNFRIAGNESTQTISLIDSFLKEQNIDYSNIEHIVCVVGPGSFTGIRTVTLVVNALAFIYPNIALTGISFFDLYDSYPLVKSSSKRDLFVKYEKSATIQIESNKNFEENCAENNIYGDTDVSRFEKEFTLHSDVNYSMLLQKLELQNGKRLAPLYVKKPNIS